MNPSARVETMVAVVLVLLLLVVGSALTDVRNPAPEVRATTFSNDRAGLRALYLLLQDLDVPTDRLLEPVSAADPIDRTVVVAGPTQPFVPSEREALLAWVAKGGRLVVVHQPGVPPTHRTFAEDLLLPLGFREYPFRGARVPFEHLANDTLRRDLDDIVWRCRRRLMAQDQESLDPHQPRLDPRAGTPIPVLEAWGIPVVLSVPFGEGEAVLVPDTVGIENLGLGGGDNALLAVDLLTGGGDREVWFDEFHHGYSPDGERPQLYGALLGQVTTTWPGRAVLVALLAALVYVAGATVRFGAPRRRLRRGGRTLTEHTDALGRIYENARARRQALRLLTAGARRAVGPRIGLSPRLPHLEFDRRLAASTAVGAAELARALVAAQGAGEVSDPQFARLAQELALSKRRFIHGRT